MRILHTSDTHGSFDPLVDVDSVDAVVHSGDFAPNSALHRNHEVERHFQETWAGRVAPNVKAWLRGKPLLLCPGNHDFFNPVLTFRAAGIDAHCIDRQHVELGGLRFFGVPYVRWWTGVWNYELSEPDLRRHYDILLAPHLEAGSIDVLVSHSPMYGVLDRVRTGYRAGAIALRTLLQTCAKPPKVLLCGHIHQSGGRQLAWSRGLVVSNAALSQRILEVNP